MKLGACYNLFDCEELLESSIRSIRDEVDHVCVVYQTKSNFGNDASPHLLDLLEDLVNKGLVDSLIKYEPKLKFSDTEKIELVCKHAKKEETGCGPTEVSDQFFNELSKRELGRLDCIKNGMTHFMSMDCDEYYLKADLAKVKKEIFEKGYEATACRMRTFGKFPTIEYVEDNINAVPFIHILSPDKPFRLASPYPSIVNREPLGLDPTRRITGVDHSNKFKFFKRNEIVMFHMTFTRKDIRKKLENVSNKRNYAEIQQFLTKWDSFKDDSQYLNFGILHPHPNISQYFTRVQKVPNYFGIDLNNMCRVCCKTRDVLMRCSACKKAKYCGENCQLEDWPKHKLECKPAQ